MTIFIVTNKATGQEIYRYASDAPIEWQGIPGDWYNTDNPSSDWHLGSWWP